MTERQNLAIWRAGYPQIIAGKPILAVPQVSVEIAVNV